MTAMMLKLLLPLLFLSMISPETEFFSLHAVCAEFEHWCIANEQTPDEELRAALDWACGRRGADCSKIQDNQPCYFPYTPEEPASYAFNSYFQKFQHSGGSCYF